MNKISEITRMEIIELLKNGYEPDGHPESQYEADNWENTKINIYGRLSEIDFLRRIYNFELLPSSDERFRNFEDDVFQHTVNNEDYPYDWIYDDRRLQLKDGSDKIFLDFIKEIFHPIVRKLNYKSLRYLEIINKELKNDGYRINVVKKESGRDIYGWVIIKTSNEAVVKQLGLIKKRMDSTYIQQQTTEMVNKIQEDPTAAIGLAKELIETCCITILDKNKVSYSKSSDIISLTGKTANYLEVLPKYITDTQKR